MDWIGLGQQKMDPCPTLIQMLSDAQLISHSSYRGYSPPPKKKKKLLTPLQHRPTLRVLRVFTTNKRIG